SYCYKYDPVSDKVTTYYFPSWNYFASWSIAETTDQKILIGSTYGLWIKDERDDKDPVQFNKLNGFDVLNKSTVYSILPLDEDIWLCTDNGLFLIDLEQGIREYITEARSGLPNNSLLYIHKDAEGIYWIASRGGGLIRWDRKQNTFKSYTVNEGLSHNVIYAIYEDDFGFLWLTSDFGLMRFDKKSGFCRTFLTSEGIPHEEF